MARITVSSLLTASLALTANAQAPVWGQPMRPRNRTGSVLNQGHQCPGLDHKPRRDNYRHRYRALNLVFPRSNIVLHPDVDPVRTEVLHHLKKTNMNPSGDSYSQTGFNINSTKPSSQNPLGNPDLPGWTSSGGLNWIGFVLTQFNASLTYSYNLAYGGATTDASLITPYAPTVLSFIDQVSEFSRSLASKPAWAPWTADNTLAGVWMGVNDVGNAAWASNREALLVQVLGRYFDQLQILYNAGVRNFVLLSVPPTQKTPLMIGNGADSSGQLSAAIKQYNELIVSNLAAFKAKNSGVTSWVVDTAASFNKAINNPTAYGAPDATCYNENGVSCLWFNDYHPGVQIQKLVGQAVAQTVGAPWFTGQYFQLFKYESVK
ncbi:fungal cellulose binding domain-containing protein [Colletotrichum tofieldiae]|nr:fungal cellulose binding domain-containing protein [Colletotrichum tofieldiae]GKT70604.1 fungal cellulose binding domain-containing protein [Colletotrichum tofieldiae]